MKITLNDLSFAYNDKPIFRGLNIELESGERPIVILGPSGSGKTTLVKLLGGLLKAQSGEVFFSGGETETNTASLSIPCPLSLVSRPLSQTIRTAFMFQEARLLPWLTALENVSIPLEKEFGREAALARARHFLSLVSLEEKHGAYPAELSGGQAQRVSMARAFAWPAPALFMDEPFQSLDIPLRISLMDTCLALQSKEKRLLIAVTHDPREAVYMGGRIIILGMDGEGIVFDRKVELSAEERAWGSARELETEIVGKLGIRS